MGVILIFTFNFFIFKTKGYFQKKKGHIRGFYFKLPGP